MATMNLIALNSLFMTPLEMSELTPTKNLGSTGQPMIENS